GRRFHGGPIDGERAAHAAAARDGRRTARPHDFDGRHGHPAEQELMNPIRTPAPTATPAKGRCRAATGACAGSVLLTTLTISFVLMALASALVTNSLYRAAANRARIETGRAEQIAETGIDVAYFELQSGTDVTGGGIGVATAPW